MPQLETNKPKKLKKAEKEQDLKGTLLSVMLLGLFIILSWGAVYALYLSR
ncbi:cytochrome c oxidase subunit 2A [Fictibacillus aquaticus]|uniref:Cytochrome c oxidase subunit 2A n=1 Tax=Fictibacillus aquaticus TaxID=2021314 RepID=A0A235FA02_9BACL|nr:cytochrome c oxidase subunit 2A [Fictibacillus aquaticus]OYD58160.1 cytochrome c oxidase subunit 2A [Fictibacillus aquaticus]